MERIELAKLCLRTSDLTLNTNNTIGTCDQYRRNYIFKNVDWRQILGDMYERYDLFNLELVSVAHTDDRQYNNGVVTVQAGSNATDRIVNIHLSGINANNSTFDVKRQSNTDATVIATYQFYNDFNKSFTSNRLTFGKVSKCDLNLYYTSVNTGIRPDTVTEFPNVTYMFNIYGII
jgi:hypothetical protein